MRRQKGGIARKNAWCESLQQPETHRSWSAHKVDVSGKRDTRTARRLWPLRIQPRRVTRVLIPVLPSHVRIVNDNSRAHGSYALTAIPCTPNRAPDSSKTSHSSPQRRIQPTHNMSSPNPNLPLPQFLSSTLQPLLPIFNDSIPSSTTSAQSTLSTAADNLYLIGRMMSSLGLYSENEDVDELGERELVFMAAAWVLGEVEGRRGVTRLEGGGGRQEDGGEGGVSMDGRIGAVKRSDVSGFYFIRPGHVG